MNPTKSCRIGLFLALLALPGMTRAGTVQTLIPSGETLVVTNDFYARCTVHPNATLLIEGGSITQAPPVTNAAVEIAAGGTCVMRSGHADYFNNNGRLQFLGGSTSLSSTENHGYMILAGGDPGIQIVNQGGFLDLYRPAAGRTNLEISADNSVPGDIIRIFSITNTLGYGWFDIEDLSPLVVVYPPYAEFEMSAKFWDNGSNFYADLTFLIPTNWNGLIISEPFDIPPTNEITLAIEPAVGLSWASTNHRGYQVQSTSNLVSGTWSDFGLPVPSLSPTNRMFDVLRGTSWTYRARILY